MPVQDVRQILRLRFRREGTVKGREIMIIWLSMACDKFYCGINFHSTIGSSFWNPGEIIQPFTAQRQSQITASVLRSTKFVLNQKN
jgi:hypothetical protein